MDQCLIFFLADRAGQFRIMRKGTYRCILAHQGKQDASFWITVCNQVNDVAAFLNVSGENQMADYNAALKDAGFIDLERTALPEHLAPLLIVAFGKPDEKIVLTEALPGENLNYYRDENDVHYVPKRRLEDVLL